MSTSDGEPVGVREPRSPGTKRAVVIGASIAGLLAARSLSETFAEVVVLERFDLPARPQPRKGVPQSNQLHVLLTGGARVLDDLFGGFSEDLIAHGAVPGDPQVNSTYYLDGYPVAAAPSGMTLLGVSRSLVEHVVRQRVESRPNVTIRPAARAVGLLSDDSRSTVTGVRLDDTRIEADLVVDASGRSSHASEWLRDLGFPAPASAEVNVDVVYVTRHYQWESHQLDGRNGALVVPYPGSPRGAGVMRVEGDRWELVLFGVLGNDPTTDDTTMREFARSLPTPDVAQLMDEAKPLDGDSPKLMRYPSSVRRYFEKVRRHPGGFLVVGDALASFNPTYGQGMTVAAQEAQLLRDLLADGPEALPSRFYAEAAKLIDAAWTLSVGGDLRFGEIEGRRTAAARMVTRYLDRYRRAASVSPDLGRTFLEVANGVAPATAMMSPSHLIRVLRHGSLSAAQRRRLPAQRP